MLISRELEKIYPVRCVKPMKISIEQYRAQIQKMQQRVNMNYKNNQTTKTIYFLVQLD